MPSAVDFQLSVYVFAVEVNSRMGNKQRLRNLHLGFVGAELRENLKLALGQALQLGIDFKQPFMQHFIIPKTTIICVSIWRSQTKKRAE